MIPFNDEFKDSHNTGYNDGSKDDHRGDVDMQSNLSHVLIGKITNHVKDDMDYTLHITSCNGLHLNYTSELDLFCITKEEKHASSIHRIIAVTGEAAREAFRNFEQLQVQFDALERIKDITQLNIAVNAFIHMLENTQLLVCARLSMGQAIISIQAKTQQKMVHAIKNLAKMTDMYTIESLEMIQAPQVSFWIDEIDVGRNTELLGNAAKRLVYAANKVDIHIGVLLLFKDETHSENYAPLLSLWLRLN